MARGNWKPDVIHPSIRCRYCGYRILKKSDIYRHEEKPCHKSCAEDKGLSVITNKEWLEKRGTAEMEIINRINKYLNEGWSEGDKVTYQGKNYEVYGIEGKMVIIISPDEKERIKVLPQEIKKRTTEKKMKCRCYINASYNSKTAWRTGKLPKPCPIHEKPF